MTGGLVSHWYQCVNVCKWVNADQLCKLLWMVKLHINARHPVHRVFQELACSKISPQTRTGHYLNALSTVNVHDHSHREAKGWLCSDCSSRIGPFPSLLFIWFMCSSQSLLGSAVIYSTRSLTVIVIHLSKHLTCKTTVHLLRKMKSHRFRAADLSYARNHLESEY